MEQPVECRLSFETFADGLIDVVGLAMRMEDQDKARDILRVIVERILMDPLSDFSILAPEHRPIDGLGPRYKRLSAFQVTPMGRGLLELMKKVEATSGAKL